MQKITVGYVVKVAQDSWILELAGPQGQKLSTPSKRSSEFYSSRLWMGSTGTVFESRRAAQRAIERTKKAVAGTGTPFATAQFEIDRLTALVPFGITTTAKVTVRPA